MFVSKLNLPVIKLEMFEVVDQLVAPLQARITELLASPVTGTDDKIAHSDTKKAYLTFLNNIVNNKLHMVFLSERKRRPILHANLTLIVSYLQAINLNLSAYWKIFSGLQRTFQTLQVSAWHFLSFLVA